MKIFNVDWVTVLRELRRWERLAGPARRAALDLLKPSAYVSVQALGTHVDTLLDAGIVRFEGTKQRVVIANDARPLLRVLRAMDRHRVFDDPSATVLRQYIDEHFSNEETDRLVAGYGWRGGSRARLASLVAFEGWLGDLLGATSNSALTKWAIDRGASLDGAPDLSVKRLRGVQVLARGLIKSPEGVPLRELAARARGAEQAAALAEEIFAGLRFLILFASLRGGDHEPMIGVWPPAARELSRPARQVPPTVEPLESFDLAVGIEDMTTVLAAAVAEPIRLREDDLAVFARSRKLIDQRLAALPQWVSEFLGFDTVARVDVAATQLQLFQLAQIGDVRGAAPHLEATPIGTRWLTLTPHDRLAALIDPLRASQQRNPESWSPDETAASFFPFALPYFTPPKKLDLRTSITRAFLSIPVDAFTSVEEFLDYHAHEANPFLEGSDASAARDGSDRSGFSYLRGFGEDPRMRLQDLWHELLMRFLAERLIALGGVQIGLTTTGTICFCVTGIGRYMLGTGSRFEYGVGFAEVIVQPNFDVVFLGTAPAAEATIARFAERVGNAPGVVFRITRASVLGAAEAGATLDDMLHCLRDISAKPLPQNVQHELSEWHASIRRAQMRQTIVLECADEETARRIISAAGAKVRRLTPTILELSEVVPHARAVLLRRIRAAGVLVDQDQQTQSRSRASGRRS